MARIDWPATSSHDISASSDEAGVTDLGEDQPPRERFDRLTSVSFCQPLPLQLTASNRPGMVAELIRLSRRFGL